ncbi:hypothetical protein [Streptomyces sp. NPDC057494]|uniref:hypothetical protein n=1 Tax=Streptomyces sp. NPDC057494 TaxID=3346148 RepID=UPI0036A3F6D3
MPPSRRRTTLLPATALAAVALAASGCSAGGAPAGGPAAGRSPYRAVAVEEPSDPSGWTLPLMAYQPDEEQRRTLVRAEQTLVRSCMKGFGLTWEPSAELPVVGPRNAMDWRYGIHDARLAATRGFQPEAAQQERYERALRAEDAEPRLSPDAEVVLGGSGLPPEALAAAGPEVRAGTFHGRRIPEGGCFTVARDRLGTSAYGSSQLVARLSGRSFPEATKDPAVKAVFGRWSACMKAEGFTYADPTALFDDPRFGREPHPVTPLETSTALADIRCRGTLRLAETWHAAETRLQNRYIEENKERLETERRALDRAVGNARKALAEGDGRS